MVTSIAMRFQVSLYLHVIIKRLRGWNNEDTHQLVCNKFELGNCDILSGTNYSVYFKTNQYE